MRREQGRDLMDFIKLYSGNYPVIITGDFNANPSEPVYQSLIRDDTYPLDSAYRYLSNKMLEPPYTTWKIREDSEYCQTLDYIFFTRNSLKVDSVLQLPTSEDIGEGRVPSYRYPSDHFALVADLHITETWSGITFGWAPKTSCLWDLVVFHWTLYLLQLQPEIG